MPLLRVERRARGFPWKAFVVALVVLLIGLALLWYFARERGVDLVGMADIPGPDKVYTNSAIHTADIPMRPSIGAAWEDLYPDEGDIDGPVLWL